MAPPTGGTPAHPGPVFELELVQEKAANLGRLWRRLADALRALDVASVGEDPADAEETRRLRERRLGDAAEALFLYVAQREVMGLGETQQALDELGVPREVRLRMAPRSVQARIPPRTAAVRGTPRPAVVPEAALQVDTGRR